MYGKFSSRRWRSECLTDGYTPNPGYHHIGPYSDGKLPKERWRIKMIESANVAIDGKL